MGHLPQRQRRALGDGLAGHSATATMGQTSEIRKARTTPSGSQAR